MNFIKKPASSAKRVGGRPRKRVDERLDSENWAVWQMMRASDRSEASSGGVY